MDTTSGRLSRADASGSLPNWRYLLGRMHLTVATGDFAAALAFVDRVGALAEEQGHHPEIDLRWGRVHVATGSHDVGGVSERDVRLGLAIDTVVTELGLTSQPHRLGEVEIAVDAMDIGAVRPFWAAVLGPRARLFQVRWSLHLLRGVIGIAMLASFAFGLRTLPLSEAYSIFFVAPLLITALAAPMLGERVGANRWWAIIIGLVGVLVVLRPTGTQMLSLGGIAVLGSTVCYAISAITA